MGTSFTKIYDSFLSKVTDDMYMEMTELDTFRLLEDFLKAAIQKFESPRTNLSHYELSYEDVDSYKGIESDNVEVPAFLYMGGAFDEDLTEEERIIRSERDARLWTAIDHLPTERKKIFLLSKRDGLTYQEIATELGISIKTVEHQISKALKTLRETAIKIYTFFFG